MGRRGLLEFAKGIGFCNFKLNDALGFFMLNGILLACISNEAAIGFAEARSPMRGCVGFRRCGMWLSGCNKVAIFGWLGSCSCKGDCL